MNPYEHLEFPEPPEDRPYVVINMVSTIDGKILSGNRDEHVMDLGSQTDHRTMRLIESKADAVMIGAGSLRATPNLRYEGRLKRIVVTATGKLDYGTKFFSEAASQAYVVCGPEGSALVPENIQKLPVALPIDWKHLLKTIRTTLGVRHLLVEGGSELNGNVLRADVVDELFLTLAPKVKLGRNVPTYAGGEPLDRTELLEFTLAGHVAVEDELFLRYRRARSHSPLANKG